MKTVTSSQMSCQASTPLFHYMKGNRQPTVLTHNRAPTGVLIPAPESKAEAVRLMGLYLQVLNDALETVSERGLSTEVCNLLLSGEIVGVTNTRGRWNKKPTAYLLPFLVSRGQEFADRFLEMVDNE